MKLSDIISLAFNNLKRNIFRTVLTVLGVAVGIGALSSMVSLGKGVAVNISEQMENNDLFTGMTVSSRSMDFESLDTRGSLTPETRTIIPLTDSLLETIRAFPEVAAVFPENVKPAVISLFGRSVPTNLKAVPSFMGDFYPFVGISAGKFYTSDNQPCVVLSKSVLSSMGIILEGDSPPSYENGENFTFLPADSIIGTQIMIVTKVFDIDKLALITSSKKQFPVKNDTTYLKIAGIVRTNSFSAGIFSNGVFLPPETCGYIPSIDLRNVYDIINGTQGVYGKYNSLHVRVKDHSLLKPAKQKIEETGLNVFSIGDKLEDIETIFFMLDSILAVIGTIALLISAVGIVNTLIMAIYERRKEIGVMKSLGATGRQIKLIFYFEAALIGFAGGLTGVLGGKLASQASGQIANSQLGNFIDSNIEYFSYSWRIVVLSILFSVVVSVLASVYPAHKAAKIDPLNALRRE